MADPNSVLSAESMIDKGENSRLSSFVGAIAISDLVKSTLGPKGMDKILQSMSNPDTMNITNDGKFARNQPLRPSLCLHAFSNVASFEANTKGPLINYICSSGWR
mmetsp:Transcript_5591/g.9779  ORF Transcript_5591/g.9779 Transcript_5591/m.9779 type:complete len:105 (+) Transcript_5591:316-630(+)